jgi:hypothetical protein
METSWRRGGNCREWRLVPGLDSWEVGRRKGPAWSEEEDLYLLASRPGSFSGCKTVLPSLGAAEFSLASGHHSVQIYFKSLHLGKAPAIVVIQRHMEMIGRTNRVGSSFPG